MTSQTKFTYKRRPKPDIIRILDERLFNRYTWERNGSQPPVEVEVWRIIGLGTVGDSPVEKAYAYIIEHQQADDWQRTLKYGYFRRPEFD